MLVSIYLYAIVQYPVSFDTYTLKLNQPNAAEEEVRGFQISIFLRTILPVFNLMIVSQGILSIQRKVRIVLEI